MNREIAKSILEGYGKPKFNVGKTTVTFARQDEKNLAEIEAKTDEELVDNWKSLVWLNCVYNQVSLNDLQRIDLIELEIDSRKSINKDALNTWLENAIEEFENNHPEGY